MSEQEKGIPLSPTDESGPHPTGIVIIGVGLKERTYEECLQLGLNPNPNPPGEIHIPTDPEVMRAHIVMAQADALRGLRRS